MPYIGRDLMKQWERLYKYLLRVQQEHGTLRPEQQTQWEFLAPIFEGGENGTSGSDDWTSGIG
jgi:hypothetical protein